MPLYNAGKFLRQTLDSVVAQTFKDWEISAFEGNSTDDTVAILKEYQAKHPNIHWVSGPSESAYYAILEAYKGAHADYIMVLCASDGYINDQWIEKCVAKLDEDPELSLVWGIPFEIFEGSDEKKPHFMYSRFLSDKKSGSAFSVIKRVLSKIDIKNPASILGFIRKINPTRAKAFGNIIRKSAPPQKRAWFSYWLETGTIFPDGNMCFSRKVFDECMSPYASGSGEPGDWMDFFYSFNAKGYLSYCISEPANLTLVNKGSISDSWAWYNDKVRKAYYTKLDALRKRLGDGAGKIMFKDRLGRGVGKYDDTFSSTT